MNTEKAYAKAFTCFQSGDLQQAALICKKILLRHHRHVDALNMLGAICYRQRSYSSAEKYLKSAIDLDPTRLDAYINLGNVLQEQGLLDEAMICMKEAIRLDATSAEALNIMGMILYKKRDIDGAIHFYQSAIQKRPSFTHAYYNLGIAWESKRLYNEALTCLQKASQYDPKNFEVCLQMGILQRQMGNMNEAITWLHKALHVNPNHTAAYHHLGKVLHDAGKHREARAVFEQVLKLNPEDSEAYYNLGIILHEQGELAQATYSYRKVIQLNQNYAPAYNNLGTLLHEKGNADEAKALFQQALQLNPEYADAYYNFGTVLQEQNDLDGAIIYFRKAIHLNPHFLVAYNNLGNTMAAMGRLTEAAEIFHRALEINPDYVFVLNNLSNVLKDQGKLREAEASSRRAIHVKPDFFEAYSNCLLCMNYNSSHSAQTIFSEHARLGRQFREPFSSQPSTYSNTRIASRRLRIGYISPDFREHSVAYFIEPVIKGHTAEDFEVVCYSNSLIEDHVTERMKKHATHWRNITRLSNEIVFRLIREDGIDILIDLTGHTGNNRLPVFARKPAPLQVTWIGYPTTTGLSTIDYKIVDKYTDPPGVTEQFYTEHLLRLPQVFLCYLPDADSPDVKPLPALSAGYITFGSFNNFSKISPLVFRIWQTILQVLPNSRFIIKAKSFSDMMVRNEVLTLLRDQGIADERIELLSWTSSRREHLDLYSRVDIALDTFPYHGTTTTCEALWMGVPVITLSGDTHASRVGVSLLSNVGLPELITYSQEEYIERAVTLGQNIEQLHFMRMGMREKMAQSPLTDMKRFITDLETCYKKIWETWCASQ